MLGVDMESEKLKHLALTEIYKIIGGPVNTTTNMEKTLEEKTELNRQYEHIEETEKLKKKIMSFEEYVNELKTSYNVGLLTAVSLDQLKEMYNKYIISCNETLTDDVEFEKYSYANREERPYETVDSIINFFKDEFPFFNGKDINFKLYGNKATIIPVAVTINIMYDYKQKLFNSKEGLMLYLMNNTNIPIRKVYIKYIDGKKQFALEYYVESHAPGLNNLAFTSRKTLDDGIEF